MKLKDIKDVLTFASFNPEPDDSSASWPKRFPSKRTLLLNVGKDTVSWCGLEKGCRTGAGGSLDVPFKEAVSQMGEEWRSMTDEGWCAVSVSTRFVISLESNLSRRKGNEMQIRSNPKAALGAKAERGKRYAVRHNSESNTSVLLAVEEEMVRRIENLMRDTGLNIGRISCGTFAMITDLIDQVSEARRLRQEKEGSSLGSIVMIACCQGSVCVLTQQEEQWIELRSRSDLYEGENLEPVLSIVMPLIENAGSSAHIVFMNDQTGSEFPQLLQAKAPHVPVSDVTVDNQLWKLLADI